MLIHGNSKETTKPAIDLLEKEYEQNIKFAITETNGKLSLPYSMRAYEIAKQLEDKNKIANSCIELSHDYEKLGQLNTALNKVLEAERLFEIIENKESIALCYNIIGTLFFKQGDTLLSLNYLNEALEIHRQSGLKSYTGGDLVNIGEIYRKTGKQNLAKSYFTEALRHFKKGNDSIEYAYTIGNLGLVYTSIGDTDSATICLNEAGSILKYLGDYYPIAIFTAENAKILLKENKYNEAVLQAKKSIAISEQEGLIEQISEGYKLLSDIQKLNGNYKDAYEAYVNYQVMRDSLTNADIIRKMENQRINFEISKRETVIKNLENINLLRTKILVVFGIGFFLILFLSIFLYHITRKLRVINKKLNANTLELENTLSEKEALLKEIHHRVKNNLQIISSLLSLQSRRLNDKVAKTAIVDSHHRLQAISLIHQYLYQTENFTSINVQEYICEMMDAVKIAYSKKNRPIEHFLDIEDLNLDVDTAIPIGLIINELVTNSYKYAFPNKTKGHIAIRLKTLSNFKYQLMFEDNGAGLPQNFNPEQLSSLGIKLINILVKQLDGELHVKNDNGTKYTIVFMNKNYSKKD